MRRSLPGIRSRVTQAVRRVRPLKPARIPIDASKHVRAILRSPLLDVAFYETQAGRTFASRKEAATHFVEVGSPAQLSPSPLFQAEWYRYHTPGRQDTTFNDMFFGSHPLTSTAPWFDARVFAERSRRTPRSTREALEVFLSRADDDTLLPVHPLSAAKPTLGAARATGMATGERNRRRAWHSRERFSTRWTPVAINSTAGVRPSGTVSIVLPVRNRAGTVPAAIESVLAQTYSDWELIVVDDGSTDSTVGVVQSYARAEPRISVIVGPAAGVCAARNAGIIAATGEYVAFLDSDNVWMADFLERSISSLSAESDVVAVHAVAHMLGENGEPDRFLAMAGDRDDLIFGGNFVDLNTFVVRRRVLDEIGYFDESLRRWVDYDLAIRVFAAGRVELLPFIGVEYAQSEDTGRISVVEAPGWEQVVLSKYLLDWQKLERDRTARSSERISIIMPTYADWAATLIAVRSVLDQSAGFDIELVVVDNGSPSSTSEILAAALSGAPRVQLLALERNTNFALGSNLGFAVSSGTRVVFLNNDIIVSDGWLAPLLNALTTDPAVHAAQPLILNEDGSVQSAGYDFSVENDLPVESTRVPHGPTDILAPSGVAMMTWADEVISVHGFDPLYSNGLDDLDFTLRLNAAAPGRYLVIPASVVVHSRQFSPGRFAAEASNARIFRHRWQNVSFERPFQAPL